MAHKRNPKAAVPLKLPKQLQEMQAMLQAYMERFPKPPDVPLPLEAWREALAVFEVPKRKVAAFNPPPEANTALEFTHLVLHSPFGMMTDWKAVMIDFECLLPILSRLGVPASLEDGKTEYQLTFQANGEAKSYARPWSWEDNDFQGQVFDLERILPGGIAAYSLVEYEKTDTYGHAFLTADRWGRVQQLLGDWFGCTFRKHPAKPLFRPTPSRSPGTAKKGRGKGRGEKA
jgi:hypothetical protein